MVAAVLPFRVGPDLHPSQTCRPFHWDEAVVDVKWPPLFPLKIISGLLLFAVSFAMKEMVAAHQAKLGEHFHQGAVAKASGVFVVPNSVGVEITRKNSSVLREQ